MGRPHERTAGRSHRLARPRLVALAVDEQTLDLVIEEIAEHLGGAGLVSMEPGLALEV